MLDTTRPTWLEIREEKKQRRELGLDQVYSNMELMEKAVAVAAQIARYGFVLSIGVFGSTARGETGEDIDLLVFDDGTVSGPAAKAVARILPYCFRQRGGRGVPSGGAYATACYIEFMKHLSERDWQEKVGEFFIGYMERPPDSDLIFVDQRIRTDQGYLDELLSLHPDPFFFRNIGEDVLMFHPEERQFRETPLFPGFINGGVST